MPHIGGVELIGLIVGLALLLGLVVALIRRTSGPRFIDRWAADHGISLTDLTRDIVGDYLARGTRWRSIGAVVGAVVPLGTKVPGLEMMLGYLTAAILFELRARPIVVAEGHSAALSPRTITDYVPSTPLVQFRTACLAALGTSVAVALVPLRESVNELGAGPWVAAAGTAALFVTVEGALRLVARRRQPAGPAELIAADDALRSASMHALLGAGIGIALLVLGTSMLALSAGTDIQLIRWTGPWLGFVSIGLGIVSWLRLGHDTPWVVRRSALTRAQT